MRYDVIIIGAGPSGIFCAYELKEQNQALKILMIEKGRGRLTPLIPSKPYAASFFCQIENICIA